MKTPFILLILPVLSLGAGLIVGTKAGRVLGPEDPAKPAPLIKASPVELSVYSSKYHGRTTASGEAYDHHQAGPVYSAAVNYRKGSRRPAIGFGRVLEVSAGSRKIQVRITDTGSWKPKLASTWLDLPPKAWQALYPKTAPGRRVAQFRVLEEGSR
jgi:hypothetical protein